MVYLFDVNVVLALFDPAHEHHSAAHAWYRGEREWASCPLTENAVIRIASSASYPGSPGSPAVIASMLDRFRSDSQHIFWPDDITLLNQQLFPGLQAVGSRQLTDIYLLGLAVSKGGKLATLDRSIPASAVRDGAAALELIPF
ncbi:MAG TPA: TA system VapC family ribonuclease toxin [Candidatus Acidoferrum sp.]|nr:TA system VapC family ribonuclease toxin [Candidatus Acidoferrum sp.]